MIRFEEAEKPLHEIHNGLPSGSSDKLVDLKRLRFRTRPILDDLCASLSRVTNLVCEVNEKSDAAALGKASRPSIRAVKPWFDIEHLRDFLRFRASFASLDQLRVAVETLLAEAAGGNIAIVKFDSEKFFSPNPMGWRMVAIDIRFPATGMIVEFYMTFGDVILVNDRFIHALFEKWRNRRDGDLTIGEVRDRTIDIALAAGTNYEWFRRSLSMDNGDWARKASEITDAQLLLFERPSLALGEVRDRYDRVLQSHLDYFRTVLGDMTR